MTRVGLVLALLAGACGSKKERPPGSGSGSAVDTGTLPAGAAETQLFEAQCRACHSLDYLSQQRLSETGWMTTIDKMRRWGALLTSDEQMKLAAFAAKLWPADLPDRAIAPGAPPAGALPLD